MISLSASSEDWASGDESGEESVAAHGLEWYFLDSVLKDVFQLQAAKSKPDFHVHDPQSMTALACWRQFFPESDLPHILRCTSAAMPEKSKEVTRGRSCWGSVSSTL